MRQQREGLAAQLLPVGASAQATSGHDRTPVQALEGQRLHLAPGVAVTHLPEQECSTVVERGDVARLSVGGDGGVLGDLGRQQRRHHQDRQQHEARRGVARATGPAT
ncbi:MAG: hypothetical protein IPN77_14390 [Sandaracinaceae bacterium]|nr:hypothetical protein [Sandaracinaceae bacterium]